MFVARCSGAEPAEDLDAVRRLAHLDAGPPVVGPRVEVDAQLGVAGERTDDAHDLEWNAHAEALGDAGRVVDDLPGRSVELEARRDDVRVREVAKAPAHLAIAREQPERPALLASSRRANTDGESKRGRQSHSMARGGRHQREHAPVADGAVVEGRHVERRGGGGTSFLVGGTAVMRAGI